VTDLKLTQRDAWKTFRVSPILAADQPLNHLHAVQMVVDLEEGVKQKQLPDGVAEVQQLHRKIGCYQIVAVQLSCKHHAHAAGKHQYSGVLTFNYL